VFLAIRGCEFLGGGRKVCAISLRGPVIALVEDSLFSGLASALIPSNYKERLESRIHLLRCRFESSALTDWDITHNDRGKLRIVVRTANVNFGAPDLTKDMRQRLWGALLADETAEVHWNAAPPWVPLETLATMATAVRNTKGDLPVHVKSGFGREGAPEFYVATLDANFQKNAWMVAQQGGTPVATEDRGGGWSLGELESMVGLLDLDGAARLSRIPLDTDVREAGIGTQVLTKPPERSGI
jgi:hypothetical protein